MKKHPKSSLKALAILNIKAIVFWLICFGVSLPTSIVAQGTYQVGVLPSVNFNKKLANNWSLNFRVEARQLAFEGDFLGKNETNLEYVLTDFSLLAAKKVGLNSRIAGGYLIRFRDDEWCIERFSNTLLYKE